VYAAAGAIDKRLANPDVIESAMLHMHHVVINNWEPTRKRSYNYFYTCARAWILEYLAGTGRGKVGGSAGKKKIKRKTITVPKGTSREEAIEIANSEDLYTWTFSSFIRRKKKDDPTMQRMSFYRHDGQMVDLKPEHNNITAEEDWSWSDLADTIDFQILSEYIPDTNASDYTKKIAYVLLDIVEMLVNNEVKRNISVLLTYQLVRSKLGHTVTNEQLFLSKDVLRQAFQYYAEDEM